MAGAWGGSWGSSWGVSWGTGAAPAATVTAPSYGGDYEKYWKRLRDAQKKLVEVQDEPPAVQAAAVREAAKVIDAVEAETFTEAPSFTIDLDGDLVRQQLESLRHSITALAKDLETRERRRRNNNWLMMQ